MAAMFSNLDLHASHVLMLDTKALDALGPANPFTLHTICAVLSRCADFVEQGRRLENRSWRLWNTAQTLESPIEKPATSTAIANLPSYTIPNKNCAETRNGEVPGLSHSVESLTGGSLTEYFHSLSPDGTKSQVLHQLGPASEASSQDPLPEPSSSPISKHVQPKQPARFALGGSCSSSEHSQSIENVKATSATVGKKPTIPIGGPSGEDPRKGSDHPVLPNTRIRNLTAQALLQSESAVDSNTEAEYVDECAIDEDDSSDWEDYTEDGGKSSVDDKLFQRVESKANLASRPSLITLMLAQNERARTLGNQASQSAPAIHRRTAPNGPSPGVSPNDSELVMMGMRHSALKPINEIPRSSAQPTTIHATHPSFPATFSPRTTRRDMLATELTESLQLQLDCYWQHQKLVSEAMPKRRHTSQDVANLQRNLQRPCIKPSKDVEILAWDKFFLMGTSDAYHFKGW